MRTEKIKGSLSRGGRLRLAGTGALLTALLAVGGCNILDVTNPNNVIEDALQNPTAVQAEVNGSVAQTMQGLLMMYGYIESASDNMPEPTVHVPPTACQRSDRAEPNASV